MGGSSARANRTYLTEENAMSDSQSNDRNKVAMRDKNSTNLNTSGKEGVVVRSPRQGTNVSKYTSKSGHPDRNKRW